MKLPAPETCVCMYIYKTKKKKISLEKIDCKFIKTRKNIQKSFYLASTLRKN